MQCSPYVQRIRIAQRREPIPCRRSCGSTMSCPTMPRLRLALAGAGPRMIFVVHGSALIEGRALSDGEAWHGEAPGNACARQRRRHLLALRACAGGMRAEGRRCEECGGLAAEARGRGGDPAGRAICCCRRQRYVSARRLRLPASASRARHSLPHRRRHPDRHPRQLDQLWPRRRLV